MRRRGSLSAMLFRGTTDEPRRLRRFTIAAAAAVPLLLAGPARASILDFMSGAVMSEGMPKVPGDVNRDKPRSVLLNGFPLFVETGRTNKRVNEVLDFYQQRYQGGALKELAGKPVAVRRDGADTGTLMTVEVPDKATALQMMDGKRTLSSAGPLRMVYARRSGISTDYMAIWSDRAMPPTILQPVQSGDAPGQDVPGVPRPDGVRTMTFAEPKAGYLLVMYRVNQSPESALLSTASRIAASGGWIKDPQFSGAAEKRRQLVARFSQGVRDVVVTARQGKSGTQITYLARDLN